MQIVPHRVLQRRDLGLADVDSHRNRRPVAGLAQRGKVRGNFVRAAIIESEPVYECALRRVTKQTWAIISRLCARRDGARLDKTEAERLPSAQRHAVLVEAGRESNGVWKTHAKNLARHRWFLGAPDHSAQQQAQDVT